MESKQRNVIMELCHARHSTCDTTNSNGCKQHHRSRIFVLHNHSDFRGVASNHSAISTIGYTSPTKNSLSSTKILTCPMAQKKRASQGQNISLVREVRILRRHTPHDTSYQARACLTALVTVILVAAQCLASSVIYSFHEFALMDRFNPARRTREVRLRSPRSQ